MNVTCSATPVCPIILNSTCVFYEGVDLTYIGVTTNDSIQTALEKINNSLGNYPIPTLQQVTNSGNTVTVPSARSVGIHVSIQDIATYQAAFIGEAPLQTANTVSTSDIFVAKLNGQAPTFIPGYVGGFVSEMHGNDNIGHWSVGYTDAGNSAGFVSNSIDGHTGVHFQANKIILDNVQTVFQVDNDGSVLGNSFTKINGQSTEFLKADGSIDSNTYLTNISGITAGGELSGTYPNPTLVNSAVVDKVLTGLNITGGTIIDTDSILSAFGKLQNQVNGIVGGTVYKGTWNALTNVPFLQSGVGTNGDYYVVNVAGTTSLDGITDWNLGDWAIFSGSVWQKVDNTDAVVLVNGYAGNVSLVTGDIFEGAGSLPGRPSQLFFTNSRARTAISSSATGLSYDNVTGIFTVSTGYVIPTASQETNWNDAYTDRYRWDGGSTGIVAGTGRTSLGATTIGSNIFTSTNPNAITFLRANADNNVSWLNAADFRTAIGAGTSTVTPSALTKTDDTNVTLTLGGSPNVSLLEAVSITVGWSGTLADSRITSAATWNAKQSALLGTGLVKSVAGTISYITDNSTNWNTAYTNMISTLTTIGNSGSANLSFGTLNIPTYTLAGLGGQPQLNGTGFVKASGTTVTYDNSTYALDNNVVHRTGNELVAGVKSFIGTGVITYTPFSNTLANFVSNVNDFQTVYTQNLNNGSDASADFVAYNDASDVNSYFIDMGINSSNFSSTIYPIFPANSAYLFTGGGTGIIPSSLYLGTSTALSDIVFFVGGVELSNIAGYIKENTRNFLFGQSTDDGINRLQVTGGIKSTGDVTVVGSAYANGDIGSDPHQLVTKEYVDNLASAGLHIHPATRLQQSTNLTATYVDGGTTPTVTAISGGTILTSVGHGLSADNMIVFNVSGNGIVAGSTYFVYEVLSLDTFSLSATINGTVITTFTNGTGLTLTSRANSGVGATLTNASTQVAFSVDSVLTSINDRILVSNQTLGFQNGVYIVTTVGNGSTNWVLTRSTDTNTYGAQDPNSLGGGDYFFVTSGTINSGKSYVVSNVGEIIFGTTSINFTLFSAAPTYTGTAPINVTGQVISLSGTVDAAHGGTGTSTVAVGDLLYGSAIDTWSKLPLGAAYKSLMVNASGTQIEWNAVELNQTTAVSGQLGIGNGGTGASTAPLALAALGGQSILSGTGIVKSVAGTISYLTDNSINWDSAYTNRITSLTVTGSSGSATLLSNVLNIPTYTLAGLGGQASSTNLTSLSGLTYASTSFVKMTAAGTFALDTTVYTSNTGTVTSVAGGNGMNFTTFTTSGTITLGTPSSTTLSSTNATTTNSHTHAFAPGGTTAQYISGAGTLITFPTLTDGTVTSVAALTLGTTGTDLNSTVANGTTTPVITLNVPTASSVNRGVLSSADWTTFNNKQDVISNNITGTGTLNYLPKFTSTQILGNSSIQDSGTLVTITNSTKFIGLNIIQGTTLSDTAPLGTELATTGVSDASWTGTSFATGYTHTIGSVTTLTQALSAVVGTFYQITYTVSGRTAGSISISFGGGSVTNITSTGATGPIASTTATLVITPTTDFDGTLTLSVKSIGISSPISTLSNSAATPNVETRLSSSTSNTFIGNASGRRSTTGTSNTGLGAGTVKDVTSGNNNSSFGYNSGAQITTGSQNVSLGSNSLNSITSGTSNTAVGYASLFLISGSSNQNTAIGNNAGRYISGGVTALTSCSNSIFIGSSVKALQDISVNETVIGYNQTGLGSNSTIIGGVGNVKTAIVGRLMLGSTTDDTINQLQVTGSVKSTSSVQVGDNVLTADSTKVGAIRYRSDANNSYMDMVMQTGASTYEWVNVVQNTWV